MGMTSPPEDRPLRERVPPTAVERVPTSGEQWRELTLADLPAIRTLHALSEEFDGTPYRTTADELAAVLDQERPHRVLGGFTTDGVLVAYGAVRLQQVGDTMRALCSGKVHPDWRRKHIGTGIVTWQMDASYRLLAHCEHRGPAQVGQYGDDSVEVRELLMGNGFTARYSYSQVRRPVTPALVPPALPPHLVLQPLDAEWTRLVREAVVNSSEEQAAGAAMAESEWDRLMRAAVPDWSALVVDRASDRTRVAGYVISTRWDEDWDALGWKEGYIDAFGVFGSWRGKGVGRTLLAHAVSAFERSGMDYACADVASNEGAEIHALYEAAGFVPTTTTTYYAIDI